MLGRRFLVTMTVLMIAASLVPMAEAQGRGMNRGPVRIEWTAPESVKGPNHTVALEKDGSGSATFRVGYSSGGGGGGPAGGASFLRVCQPGTKIVIPLLVAPNLEIAPHMVSISPDKASFDVSTQPPSVPPSMGGSMTRWSENHVVKVHYETANITVDLATLNITTGPSTITGPGCQPSAPSVSTPVTNWVNFTMPAKPATVKAVEAPAESPGFDLVSIVLVGLVALAFVARRRTA